MHPNHYLAALRKRWTVLVALAALGGLAAFAYASSQPVLFRATSSVFLSSQRGETTSELVQGSTFTENLVESYAELVTLPVVLDPVIEELGLPTDAASLAKSVTAEIKLNTVIIEVTASDRDPQAAADIANAVTASLAGAAERLSPSGADETPAIEMSVVKAATPADSPYAPNILLYVVTGLGLGLMLGYVYALTRELLNVRITSDDDVKEIPALDGVAFLGSLSHRRGRRAPVVVVAEPQSLAAEEYRRFCTNLEFAGIDRRIRALTITSAMPGEGKTTTSVNVTSAMAERGLRVLLVDADLRRPAVAAFFGLEGAVGLTDVLLGAVGAEQAIQSIGEVDVLPAGTPPPNVAHLVGSQAMARLVTELMSHYDFVVFDTPPLLPVTDALTFANLTDGAVIVARQGRTRRQELARAVESLTFVKATVLGVVLNGVARAQQVKYGYGHSVNGSSLLAGLPDDVPVSFFSVTPPAAERAGEAARARR